MLTADVPSAILVFLQVSKVSLELVFFFLTLLELCSCTGVLAFV